MHGQNANQSRVFSDLPPTSAEIRMLLVQMLELPGGSTEVADAFAVRMTGGLWQLWVRTTRWWVYYQK